MKNKILLFALCLLTACSTTKKLTSVTSERKETDAFRELAMRSYLDSLFRSNLKLTVSYTEENFLPDIPAGTSVVPATTSPVPSPVAPSQTPVSKKQLNITLESGTESHVRKGDTLSDRSGIRTSEEKNAQITKEKKNSPSWKFLLWLLFILVLIAAAVYCAKKKINPLVELLKLIRKCL